MNGFGICMTDQAGFISKNFVSAIPFCWPMCYSRVARTDIQMRNRSEDHAYDEISIFRVFAETRLICGI